MARPSHRQALVDTSLGVFQAQGFNGSSVQDLTDAAGVPKGSFYNHFASKEELAMEALRLYVSENGLEILQDSNQAPIERLRKHFKANWKTFRDRGYQGGCFLGALSSEIADTHEVARTQFERYFNAWSNAIKDVLRQAQLEGDLDGKTDCQELARFILNSWQGSLLRAKVSKSEGPFNDFLSLTFTVLLKPKIRV